MHKIFLLFLCLIFSFTCLFANTNRLYPITSYGVFSENYEFVYIYIIKKDTSDLINLYGKDGELIRVPRKIFSREGLYNFNEKKFLWSIQDNLSQEISVRPFNDGVYLMAEEDPLPRELTDHVFSFYKRGKVIKKFTVEDFCTDVKSFPISPFRSLDLVWYSDAKLDVTNKLYSFISCKKEFKIDVTTGAVTSKVIPEKKVIQPGWFKRLLSIIYCWIPIVCKL